MRRDRRGGQAVRTVHVEPHPSLGADVGDPVDRVDRARERRARGRDHRDGGDPGGHVAIDRLGQRIGPQPAGAIDRKVTEVVRPDPQQLDRPCDRVVHLGGAVDRETPSRQAVGPGAGHRLLARRRERGHVADRPAAGERPDRGGEPDEFTHPANGLLLDLRGGPRVDGQVDVVRVGEQVGDRPDLQTRRPDEREVPRARLCDRTVQHARGIVERLVHRHGRCGQPGLEEAPHALVERGLLGPVPIEAPPRLLDQLRRVHERLLARGVETKRPFRLGHLSDATRRPEPAPPTAGRAR